MSNISKDYLLWYYTTDHWKSFAATVRKERQNKCEAAGCGNRGYQVHHLHYRSLWNEAPEDVKLLCDYHHRDRHGLNRCPTDDELMRMIMEL